MNKDASSGKTASQAISHLSSSAIDSGVCAVIVSFNPDAQQFAQLLAALVSQVAHVVIVDNGSNADTIERLHMHQNGSNVAVDFLEENRGIAYAHNKGISHARRLGANFVLLLDHDSRPAFNMVERLVAGDRALRLAGVDLAAVGPQSIDNRTGKHATFVRRDGLRFNRLICDGTGTPLEVDFLISSGTLISLEAIETVGLMRDELFIDHVDTDWCFRAKACGMRIFAVCDAHLFHSLGDDIRRTWFLRWRDVHVHSTLRDYYMFRNTVYMVRKTPMPWVWRVRLLSRLILFVGFSVAYLPPRLQRLHSMADGIWDGLANRGGRR
ncbi:glycosyltransferase family 2 protein [Caballeronia sordidicola]|uniref:glycosyltransferase family 2 protein n=1 Tax=Caballeronia sordidicola TaxID=196367 RepID=UPI000B772D5C|nr:glycosyltransferase family 2 protein [Caballeronia sordidicola]